MQVQETHTYVCVKLYKNIPTQTVPSINNRNKMLFSFKHVCTVTDERLSDIASVAFVTFIAVEPNVWFKLWSNT